MRHYILQHPIDGVPVSLMPFSYEGLDKALGYIAKCVIEELEASGYCSGYGTFHGTKDQALACVADFNR